jgi:serine protease inhibitor
MLPGTTRSIFAVVALVGVSVVLPACESLTGPRSDADEIRLPRALTADERSLIGAGNRFAFDWLRQIPAGVADEPNAFVSPLSASMALGMAMNGADGATWSQMRTALGFGGLAEPAINGAYRDLIALLRELDPAVEFGLANSVWAREGVPFHDTFLDRTRRYFDAHVEALDFTDPASLDVMNDWVADRTQGRIEELIDEIPDEAIMYLVNAVYFNGDWVYRFDEADTRPRSFTRPDGSTVEVEMMEMETDLRAFRDERAAVVELPYGGRAFSAIAALPPPGASVADLVAGLDLATWTEWMDRLQAAEPAATGVRLPRFELRDERGLKDDLMALGMVDAFTPGLADFTRLTPLRAAREGKIIISRVDQKSFVKVDERGTEAAAATFVEVAFVCAGCGAPTFVFDRPFLFAIRERLSGTILFIGVIGDPTG